MKRDLALMRIFDRSNGDAAKFEAEVIDLIFKRMMVKVRKAEKDFWYNNNGNPDVLSGDGSFFNRMVKQMGE